MTENNTLTTPLSVKEVYTLLGVAPRSNGYDIGYICSNLHEKINHYARFKPIRYPQLTPLENYQFKGTDEAQSSYMYYGLKPTNPVTGAVTSSTPNLIHNASLTYYPPTGGEDQPYRLSDFNGYNDDAHPIPNAVISDEGYWNDASWATGGVTVKLSNVIITVDGDEDSVNLLRFMGDDWQSSYLCALVSDGTNSYITALDYIPEGKPTPMMYGDGIAASGSYALRIQKPVYGGTTYPWTSITDHTTFTISLCLVNNVISAGSQPPYLGTSATNCVSLDYNWLNVTSNMSIGDTVIFPLFGALNKTISLMRKSNLPGYYVFDSISGQNSNSLGQIIVILDYVHESGDYMNLEIDVTLSLTYGTVTKTITKTGNNLYEDSTTWFAPRFYFTDDDFGMTFSQNTIASYKMTIVTKLGEDDTHTETHSGNVGFS